MDIDETIVVPEGEERTYELPKDTWPAGDQFVMPPGKYRVMINDEVAVFWKLD